MLKLDLLVTLDGVDIDTEEKVCILYSISMHVSVNICLYTIVVMYIYTCVVYLQYVFILLY